MPIVVLMPRPEEERAIVLGEYGGLGLPMEGHLWNVSDRNWGYGGNLQDKEDLFETYQQLNAQLHPMIGRGLSAAIYTQMTDVEVEVNGLMTYDREVIKVDVEQFKASNAALRLPTPMYRTVIPIAREQASEWAFTTQRPAEGWQTADFDDSSWRRGRSGFGTAGTPNTTVRTTWNTSDIWIRKSFELSADELLDPSSLILTMYHDEDATVYINGVRVLQTRGFIVNYAQFPIANAADALKAGTNVIAVHCHQTIGGQFIDVGITLRVPPKDPNTPVW